MNHVWLFSYLADSVVLWYYYRVAGSANKKSSSVLKLVLLVLFLPLYLDVSIPSAPLRLIVRVILYFVWCYGAEGIQWKVSAYAALFLATAYTLFQNIFFGPYLNSIFMGTEDIFASHFLSQIVLCAVTVLSRLIYFGLIIRAFPFSGMVAVEKTNVVLGALLAFMASYIKSTGMPLLAVFKEGPVQFTMYYVLLNVALLLILLFAEFIRRKAFERISLAVQTTASQSLLENIQDLRQNEESIRAMRHDIKNHVLALRLLLDDGETEEAKSYLDTMYSAVALPEHSYRTGNDLLDGLLKLKLGPAAARGIHTQVQLDFRQGSFIDSYDLCILMGNIMDNAVEACEKLTPVSSGSIRITGGPVANCLLVKAENSYGGGVIPQDRMFVTTKRDKVLHGYGLRNVRRVLERYGGTLTLSTQEDKFIVSMLIPIPEE